MNRTRQRLARLDHERAIEHEQLLDRRDRDGAFFRVNIRIRIIKLHKKIVELQPANAGINGSAKIRRIIQLKRFSAGRIKLVGNSQHGISNLLDGQAPAIHPPKLLVIRIGGRVGGIVAHRALAIGGRKRDLADQRALIDQPLFPP